MIKRRILAALAGVSLLASALVGTTPAQAATTTPTAAAAPVDRDLVWPAKPKAVGKKLTGKALWGKDANHGLPPRPGEVTTLGVINRDYGIGSLGLNNTGMDGNVYMGNPWVTFSDGSGGHSLAEFAISSDSQQQVLEWGWRKGYNGGAPKFFVGTWINGAFAGYNANFNATGSAPLPGDDVPSTDFGVGKAFVIQWDGTQSCGGITGQWWYGYAGAWKGYVCASVFPAGSGLRTGTSDFGQAFGEITMDSASSHPNYYCSDMGNGKQGSLGNTMAAYFGSLRLFGNATTNPPTLFFVHTSPASPLYGRISVAAQSNRTFSYGGPGSNSTNTAVGTTGAC